MKDVIAPPPIDRKFAARIAAKICKTAGVTTFDVLDVFTDFPNRKPGAHWPWAGAFSGATPVLFQTRLQSAPRLILSALAQGFIQSNKLAFPVPYEIPQTYRVVRSCPVEGCVHPCCQTLSVQKFARYGFLHDLPQILVTPEVIAARELQDLVEEFSQIEDPQLPDLITRYGQVFSETLIRQAFAHVIGQQG